MHFFLLELRILGKWENMVESTWWMRFGEGNQAVEFRVPDQVKGILEGSWGAGSFVWPWYTGWGTEGRTRQKPPRKKLWPSPELGSSSSWHAEFKCDGTYFLTLMKINHMTYEYLSFLSGKFSLVLLSLLLSNAPLTTFKLPKNNRGKNKWGWTRNLSMWLSLGLGSASLASAPLSKQKFQRLNNSAQNDLE